MLAVTTTVGLNLAVHFWGQDDALLQRSSVGPKDIQRAFLYEAAEGLMGTTRYCENLIISARAWSKIEMRNKPVSCQLYVVTPNIEVEYDIHE
jgi:hypothetical protein